MAEFLFVEEFRLFYAQMPEMYIWRINFCIYAV